MEGGNMIDIPENDKRIAEEVIKEHRALFSRLALEVVELLENKGLVERVRLIEAGIASGFTLGVIETEKKYKKAKTPN